MKQDYRVLAVVIALIFAMLILGCINPSASQNRIQNQPTTSPVITPIPQPTEIPDYKKISIAKDFAYLYQDMLDWNAPYGVDHFSTVSIGSASVNKDGLVVVKGICYGKDEYGRSVGRYTFEWKIEVDKAGWGNSRGISFKKD
jgi:hypothetical protein